MPRPKKKNLNLSKESCLSLLQEIYNECVEQRSTAIRIQNKMMSFMKEAADMTLIGPVLKEQQKIIDSAIEKKLQLAKLQSSLGQKNIDTDTPISALDDDIKEQLNTLLGNKDS